MVGGNLKAKAKLFSLSRPSFLVSVKEARGTESREKQTRGHAAGKEVFRKILEEHYLQPEPRGFWDVWIFTHILIIMLSAETLSQVLWFASKLGAFPETWSIIWRQNHSLCLSNASLVHSPLPLTHTLLCNALLAQWTPIHSLKPRPNATFSVKCTRSRQN